MHSPLGHSYYLLPVPEIVGRWSGRSKVIEEVLVAFRQKCQ